ncbi:MAG: heavy-metal-associated domain-containing protein [Bacteroidia bacterium]
MNIIKKISAAVILFISVFSFSVSAQTAEVKIKTSAQCDECKERIEKALAFEKGIKSATVNIEDQMVTVVYYDKRTTPEKIREAIANIGYDADDVPAKKETYDKLPKCCKKGGH